ncbi:MAG: GIY-YIG nuclease family protein [Bacteroidales bacterium]|nr:GIY-YIG nuclease family protein [Bacteroidales bacterium]
MIIYALDNIENKSGIYEIYNTKNQKRYIGQSIHIRTRLFKHINELNKNQHKNQHLQNSWNKYNYDSFKFRVIEYCSVDELDSKEDYYISLYHSNDSLFGFNYRIDNKTNRGLKWSEEQRKKMQQQINKEGSYYKNHTVPKETMEKAWNASRNKTWTEDERKRHSELLTGRKINDTSNMKLAQQGSKNPSSKLTENDVREIICLCKNKYCEHKTIAEVYGISLGSVNSISINRTWKHIDRNNIDDNFYIKGVERINDFRTNQKSA